MTESAVAKPEILRFKEMEMTLFAEGYMSRATFPVSANLEEQVEKMCLDYWRETPQPGRVKAIQINYS